MTDVKCFRCGNDENNYYVMDDGEHYCMGCLSICDLCLETVFNEDIIEYKDFYRCAECEMPPCEHFEDCGNLAVYQLTSVKDGRTLHVCECCDENYSTCEECGRQGLWGCGNEDMSYWHSADEWPTCFHCQEKLQKEAEDELRSDIDKHVAMVMPDHFFQSELKELKNAMFSDIKELESFENRRFYSEANIALAFQYIVLELMKFAKKANPEILSGGGESHGG